MKLESVMERDWRWILIICVFRKNNAHHQNQIDRSWIWRYCEAWHKNCSISLSSPSFIDWVSKIELMSNALWSPGTLEMLLSRFPPLSASLREQYSPCAIFSELINGFKNRTGGESLKTFMECGMKALETMNTYSTDFDLELENWTAGF